MPGTQAGIRDGLVKLQNGNSACVASPLLWRRFFVVTGVTTLHFRGIRLWRMPLLFVRPVRPYSRFWRIEGIGYYYFSIFV